MCEYDLKKQNRNLIVVIDWEGMTILTLIFFFKYEVINKII